MGERWWREPFRTVQTNIREIDVDMDVEAVLDFIEDYGADTWLLSVAGIVANYPSDLHWQTVNPFLAARASGDLVGDAVAAARDRGIRVVGRMDFQKLDARRAELHPDWTYVSADRRRQVYNGYISACPNGAYYQDGMFAVVEEAVGRYELSGVFVNGLSIKAFGERDYSGRYWGVCHCDRCQAGFADFAPGVAFPHSADSGAYLAYASGVIDTLVTRLRETVDGLGTDAVVFAKTGVDLAFHEANNAVGRTVWHHRTAEQVSALRTADRRRPVVVNAVSFVDIPYRWSSEDPHHFAQHLLQTIAHGGQPSTYVMGTPEMTSAATLEAGRRLTRFHRDNADLYSCLESAAEVALVRRPDRAETNDPELSVEFRGCYRSLVESHVPFDVVDLTDLPSTPAGRYRLVVLPDVGPLTENEVFAVEQILACGNAILLTGDSACRADVLQIGAGSPLARPLTRYATPESVRSMHVQLSSEADLAPVVGGFTTLEPSAEAEVAWPLLGTAPFGPPERCYGHRRTGHSAWVSGAVNGGTLGLIPWGVGRVYERTGLTRVRDAWVGKALSLSQGVPQLRTQLPEQVEVVAGRAGPNLVLHLLNRSGDAPQGFRAPVPIPAGSIELDMPGPPPAQVRARVSGIELEWAVDEGRLTVRTPRFETFEVVEIRR
ncbi:alpha-amylase family protein [Jiangella mangrovi]|uniref:Beta-galactosidase trimerisation domain-containing protein n=1 Tax=Jiangella mangrovi TaxID=1524084 RepID=A0A7W9GVX6_9ACTN|nr:alpha-amylase family protein [Jiangella mangrovi]MBB5791043.1 hypothetical protein [Jiangella mangrovi]